jgi:class 3 adenylate cyclase
MTETIAVTILFTDLVGSTAMLDRMGDEAGDELMRRHFDILRESIALHDGTEIKNLGDGLMVTFSNPADGAACAIDMQRGIARHNEAFPHQAMGMRVGLNTGVAITDAGDYFGIPVVIAKRLCDSALGGQIVMSASVRDLADGYDSRCDDLGALPLRGLSEPVSAALLLWTIDEAAEVVATSGDIVVGDVDDFEIDAELLRITGLPWARVGERHLVLLTNDRSQVARRSRAPNSRKARAASRQAAIPADPVSAADQVRSPEPGLIAIRCYDARSARSGHQSA